MLDDGTWLAGGCWTLAVALQEHFGPSLARFMVILRSPQNPVCDHVVVEICQGDACFYLDGDGVSTREELLHRWRTVERLPDPYFSDRYDPDRLRGDGLSLDMEVKNALVHDFERLISDYFGE